jgi:hypothetical protein
MRNLRQLCVALTVTFALALPAFAGEIQTTVAPPPSTQSAQASTTNSNIETGITGQMDTGSSEATASDSVSEVALNLLQSVLSLF